jgi:hypothetical protein
MDWASAPVSAAIVAGIVSLVVGLATAAVTIRVADKRAAVDEKLARLKGDLDERITRERIGFEQRQTNRRPFLERQLELCFEATETASRLASETDLAEWEKARLTFWRLYWGTLSIVEDQAVEGAMVQLGKIVPREPVNSPALPMTSLQGPSYKLAHAARNLMRTSWDVDLSALQGRAHDGAIFRSGA